MTSVILATLMAPPAAAQLAPNDLVHASRGGIRITGDAPRDDLEPSQLCVGWYRAQWPDFASLVRGTPVPGAEVELCYRTADVPVKPRKAVPSPRTDETLYELIRCDAGDPCTNRIGYLRVAKEGKVLHWYLDPKLDEARLTVAPGQELSLVASTRIPEETTAYRYLRRPGRTHIVADTP